MQQQHMVEYMVEKGVQTLCTKLVYQPVHLRYHGLLTQYKTKKTHCKGVISSTVRYLQEVLQAGVGFEPTNVGFANRCLRPLGYPAEACLRGEVYSNFGSSSSKN